MVIFFSLIKQAQAGLGKPGDDVAHQPRSTGGRIFKEGGGIISS